MDPNSVCLLQDLLRLSDLQVKTVNGECHRMLNERGRLHRQWHNFTLCSKCLCVLWVCVWYCKQKNRIIEKITKRPVLNCSLACNCIVPHRRQLNAHNSRSSSSSSDATRRSSVVVARQRKRASRINRVPIGVASGQWACVWRDDIGVDVSCLMLVSLTRFFVSFVCLFVCLLPCLLCFA